MAQEEQDPWRIWGELNSSYQVRQSGADNSRNSDWINTGTVGASRYIWRPWFAVFNGSLSLTVDDIDSNEQPAKTSKFVTGDMQLGLFPTSRFPFTTYYIESRNQFDKSILRPNVLTSKYGASQSYRSWDGRHNLRAEYENNRQGDESQKNFVGESLSLSANNRLGEQHFDTDIHLFSDENKVSQEQATSNSITVDHSYGDASNLSIENLVSASATEEDLFDSSSEFEIAQLSSFVSWHPQDNRDLRLTGSLRLSETRLQENFPGFVPVKSIDSETSVFNINQGLLYRYSENLQFGESINANFTEDGNQRITTASESLTARYLSDRVETGWGDYVWNAGSTYTNLHGDIDPERSLDSQLSHSLLNDYSVESSYQLRTNFTQSLGYLYQSARRDDKNINHSFSLTWSNTANQVQNLVRFTISDSRELNPQNDYSQLANLQYTGTNRLGRYSNLSGNVTLQLSKQKLDGLESRQTTTNGQLRYRRNRVFQLAGMTFLSELHLSDRQSENERLLEDPDIDSGMSWENSLTYSVGRLETQVEFDLVKVGSEYDRIIKFQVTRSFGDL